MESDGKEETWYELQLMPLDVIDRAVQHIRDGSIAELVYDVQTATLQAAQT